MRVGSYYYLLWLVLAYAAGADRDSTSVDPLEQSVKLALWQRGIQQPCGLKGCLKDPMTDLAAAWAGHRHEPVLQLRGGADGCSPVAGTCEPEEADIEALRTELGPEFSAAIDVNMAEHKADLAASCAVFYCGDANSEPPPPARTYPVASHPMGSVPPEDFASMFRFPLDLIKVTAEPLIPAEEAERVVAVANAEGIAGNEYTSGKYKLGGDWVKKMPETLAWFNRRLEDTIFPAAAALFPMIVRGPQVLRAHSVAILKYNSSHPRTDVHVDDGILAITLALSPKANYSGGGTFFEHLGEASIVEMEQGHCTIRPGSVRHGGHPVRSGDRYILGAFLLIADRVEHVRRLQNQGRQARSRLELRKARMLFKWALRINPKCATCLKNWAEALTAMPEGATEPLAPKLAAAAEDKLRRALELLPQDSDALFSLGALLSSQGRKDEALEAYQASLRINADDHELCYNLGVQLGDRGRYDEEIAMYLRACVIGVESGASQALLGPTACGSPHVLRLAHRSGPRVAPEQACDQRRLWEGLVQPGRCVRVHGQARPRRGALCQGVRARSRVAQELGQPCAAAPGKGARRGRGRGNGKG